MDDDFQEAPTEFMPAARIPKPPRAAPESSGATSESAGGKSEPSGGKAAAAGGKAAAAGAASEAPPKPGCLSPIVWFALGALGTLLGAAIVGIAGYDSESNGITAAIAVAFPLGFLWAGSVGALAFHFITPQNRPARIGAPFGCGCVGGVMLLALVFAFFATVWRSL